MISQINPLEWKWFDIISLFKIEKGERLVKTERMEGGIALITASSKKNGIVNFLFKERFKEKKLFVLFNAFSNKEFKQE